MITHVQATRRRVVTGRGLHGAPRVEPLGRIGFLKPATRPIHAAWPNPRELDALASAVPAVPA